MSCCGKKRAELSAQRTLGVPPTPVAETEPVRRAAPIQTFEYTGTGVLTVTGAVSGETYRFRGRDARVEVTYEDAFAMMAEPELQPIRHAG